MLQDFLLIWLDTNIDESTEDCQNTLVQLRNIVNDVNVFTECNETVDFLTEVDDIKAFLILTSNMGQHLIPLIHNVIQLDAIYIFYNNQSEHKQWTNAWVKMKGVYTDIKSVCEALQVGAKQCNQDSIAMSFVTMGKVDSGTDLNQLESTFMYTQIFKEILLAIEYNEQSFKDFIRFWRDQYLNNVVKINDIATFERKSTQKRLHRTKEPLTSDRKLFLRIILV
jgi:hypothetical protein